MKLTFKKTAPKPITEEAEYSEYVEDRKTFQAYDATLRGPKKTAAPAKPRVPVRFPKQGGPRAESPTIWHRGLAGVSLSRVPGRGEKLLDRVCKENGWTWGITTSFIPETGVVRVDVLIGTVVSGQAESLGGGNDGMKSWDELDEALGAVAKAIGVEEG